MMLTALRAKTSRMWPASTSDCKSFSTPNHRWCKVQILLSQRIILLCITQRRSARWPQIKLKKTMTPLAQSISSLRVKEWDHHMFQISGWDQDRNPTARPKLLTSIDWRISLSIFSAKRIRMISIGFCCSRILDKTELSQMYLLWDMAKSTMTFWFREAFWRKMMLQSVTGQRNRMTWMNLRSSWDLLAQTKSSQTKQSLESISIRMVQCSLLEHSIQTIWKINTRRWKSKNRQLTSTIRTES